MRKLIITVATIVAATISFADVQSGSKSKELLNGLSASWSAKQVTQPIQNQDDITIVYGGADISHPNLAPRTIV